MARVDVIMPQMGESIAEGTVSRWLKKVGESVKRDEAILEISTDKVDAEIPSPAGGTLVEIKVAEGETVEVQTVVAVIETEAGSEAATAPTPPPAEVAATESPAAPAPSAPAPTAPAPVAVEQAPVAPVPATVAGGDGGGQRPPKNVSAGGRHRWFGASPRNTRSRSLGSRVPDTPGG